MAQRVRSPAVFQTPALLRRWTFICKRKNRSCVCQETLRTEHFARSVSMDVPAWVCLLREKCPGSTKVTFSMSPHNLMVLTSQRVWESYAANWLNSSNFQTPQQASDFLKNWMFSFSENKAVRLKFICSVDRTISEQGDGGYTEWGTAEHPVIVNTGDKSCPQSAYGLPVTMEGD